MRIDAAQYASISAQMAATNSYLEVKDFEYDYLDKPPFLFWLSSLNIKLFGVNDFAYKFPSFLFLLDKDGILSFTKTIASTVSAARG